MKEAQRALNSAQQRFVKYYYCLYYSRTTYYVCRAKAAQKNYKAVIAEKISVTESAKAMREQLQATAKQLKRFQQKNESVQELRRSVNEMAAMKVCSQ